MTLTDLIFLGWKFAVPPDVCWLDCDSPGILEREHLGQHVILCLLHAQQLEKGSYLGDYSGTPLPPDSQATTWPWLPLNQAA